LLVNGLITKSAYKKIYFKLPEIKEKVVCKNCGYEWVPRADKPVQCPRCHKYLISKVGYADIKLIPKNE
jgi:rubrerythrin